MKSRLFAMSLGAFCVVLAACGGGGGGGGNNYNPPPPSSPTPSPTPYALGDAFVFAGSQNTTATYAYPSPSPYPSTNSNNTVTQTVTVTASANPYGPSTAGDFNTIETDSAALVSHTVTTNAWLGMSGSNLVEYGYNTGDDSGDTLTAAYTTPLIIDQLPEANGATWSNGAAVAYKEKYADGTTATRTYAATGTYTESTSDKLGITTNITENADGSGVYGSNGAFLDAAINDFVFSAPSANQVTITANFVQPPQPTAAPSGQPSPTPAPTITPRVYTAPAWYGTAAPPLYSQSTTVTTGVSYPSGCNVPSTYGTTGNKLVQTTNKLDTILGYTDVQTQTTYTNAQFGPVCVVLSDVQNDYYDYQDDFATATAFHLHFPGTPLSTTTITQTLTLQTGATIHDTGRRIESRAAANALLGRLAGVRAALELHNARARDARIMHFTSFMLRGSVKGGLR